MDEDTKLTRRDGEWFDTFNAAVTGLCSRTPLLVEGFNPDVALGIATVAACIADSMVVLTNRMNPESPMEELHEALERVIGTGLID